MLYVYIYIYIHRQTARLMMRGIWDPELLNQEGVMVPPLRERGIALYKEPEFEHPDEPLWSKVLAKPKSREEKISDMIPVIPVKSFAKFRPGRLTAELPDFLWDLVREDSAGQGLWDVIEQRHNVPAEVKAERDAQDAHKLAVQQSQQAEIEKTMAMEEEAYALMDQEETMLQTSMTQELRLSGRARGRVPPAC